MTASPDARLWLCGILIAPKHRLARRRTGCMYTLGPTSTVSWSATARCPAPTSSASSTLASTYDRWFATRNTGRREATARFSAPSSRELGKSTNVCASREIARAVGSCGWKPHVALSARRLRSSASSASLRSTSSRSTARWTACSSPAPHSERPAAILAQNAARSAIASSVNAASANRLQNSPTRQRLATCPGLYSGGSSCAADHGFGLRGSFASAESPARAPTRHPVDRQSAEFHNLFAADFRKDLPLYLDLAAKYAGPVLEIGCGTGRVLARLGEEGYEALGVDVSRPMLEVARRNLEPWHDRIRLADFDFRQGALFEKFDVVFATLYAFNALIDVEEQRLFLRHVSRCMKSPGVLALDCFCPLPMLRPEANGQWREIERSHKGHLLRVRDKREMLTPLLERRTQVFSVDGGPPAEHVSHRRYVPPQQAEQLLAEAGFESVRYLTDYDMASARPMGEGDRPTGPY